MVVELIIIVVASVVSALVIFQKAKDEDVQLDKNLADNIRELPPLFKKARDSIKIATDFGEKFFTNQTVKNALEEAFKCKVKIEIISEGPIIEEYKKIAEIKIVKKLNQHVMIIDGSDLRLEKPHCGHQFGSNTDVAFVFKGFPELGKKVETVFDNLWISIP